MIGATLGENVGFKKRYIDSELDTTPESIVEEEIASYEDSEEKRERDELHEKERQAEE